MAPTKLVPRSDLYSLTSPLIDMNLRSAFINAEDDISAINSMWTARVVRHENSTAHLFDWALPPLVLRVAMFQGPSTSNPTFGKVDQVPNCPLVSQTFFDVRKVP